jgi:hypothetical protein
MTAQQIIDSVLQAHRLGREDFFSRHRHSHLVMARKDAARRLKAISLSSAQIARLLRRDEGTIRFYLDETGEKQRNYALRHLGPVAKATLIAVAKAKHVDPAVIAAQWITERAEYEAMSGDDEMVAA